MRVAGELFLDDFKRLINDSARKPSASGQAAVNLNARPVWSMLLLICLNAAFAGAYYVVQDEPGSARWIALIFIALFSLMIVLFAISMVSARWLMPRMVEKQPGALGYRAFVIEDEGLRERGELGEGFTRWAGFSEVRNDEQHIFLYSGRIAIAVIPRRFFESQAQYQEFLEHIRTAAAAAAARQPVAEELPRATVHRRE